eukprot:3557939-Ditylum_brightwellii.AAC.1
MEQEGDKFGGWSYMKFSAPHSQVIMIVTAYTLCTVTSATGTTTYHQQLTLQQLNNNKVKNSRHTFDKDLMTWMKQAHKR